MEKPVNELGNSGIVCLHHDPCRDSDPCIVAHGESLSTDGRMGNIEGSLLIVHRVGVIDRKEHDRLYSADGDFDFVVDNQRVQVARDMSPSQSF